MSPESSPTDLFHWPPRQIDEQPGTAPPPPPPSISPIERLIDSIETDLLGRVGLSFDRWASRNQWAPDALDTFCWRCAGNVGPHEQDGEGCAACRATRLPWDRAMRLSAYKDEIRREVLALKFKAWRPGGRALGSMLGQLIRKQIDHSQIPVGSARIVPIPMHPLRRIRRGVDHTEVLAKAASASSGIRICKALRALHRPEQIGLSSTARARNMKNAFRGRPKAIHDAIRKNRAPVRVWVLIDDVRTTGATFTAASKALRSGISPKRGQGSETAIWVCSVGVAQGRNRREAM